MERQNSDRRVCCKDVDEDVDVETVDVFKFRVHNLWTIIQGIAFST